MTQKITKLTREELYEQVWSTPIRNLAESFGLSDRGLSKFCERYNIPTPPRGYWARLEAGQKVVRTPLPQTNGQTGATLTIQASPQPAGAVIEKRQQVRDLTRNIGVIEITETFRGLHAVVAGWVEEHRRDQEQSRRERKQDRDAWFLGPPVADLTERDRYRFRVTSAFLKAVEAQGAKVESGTLNGDLFLSVCGEKLECSIVEKLIQKPTYGRGKEEWTAYPRHHNSGLASSGHLRFTIKTYTVRGKDLIESRDKTAETLLPEFIARVLAAGPILVAKRKAREEEAERQRIAMQERAERERLERIDAERWNRFLALAENRETCIRLRAFIAELRSAPHLLEDEVDGLSGADWLAWAEAKVEAMDPLGWRLERLFGLPRPTHRNFY